MDAPRCWALPCLLLLLPHPGCKAMLYPAALAFGGPAERELGPCREAFERMKAGFSTARVVVHPAVDPSRPGGAPLPGAAEALAETLRAAGASHCSLAPAGPALAATELRHNQMRFTWIRARAHAAWVASTHPEGDLLVFPELLLSDQGDIRGLMLYVVDASGQLASVHLWNSHHFPKGAMPRDAGAAGRVMGERVRRSLQWEATTLFPPYGVG